MELAAAGRKNLHWFKDDFPEPAEISSQRELASLVHDTLTELPLDYETLLTAKYFDGTSIEDIARQEDCSATAVRSKLARARSAFREAFLRRVTP